jgi:hypothetical protein
MPLAQRHVSASVANPQTAIRWATVIYSAGTEEVTGDERSS